MATPQPTAAVLQTAAGIARVDATDADLIRDGSHAMYRLRGDIVARVGRPGTAATAEREVAVSQWLTTCGLPVTQTLPDLPQPVIVNERPVTWWRLLPKHQPATTAELGAVLRALHDLPVPTSLPLPVFNPFMELDQPIDDTARITPDDRTWFTDHVAELRTRYRQLAFDEPHHVIHGDAWQANVATPVDGPPILLDLEKVAIGHPDWDLILIAVDHTDFDRLSPDDYRAFVHAYGGHDVTTTPHFRTLAEIQEHRWVRFVIRKSATDEAASLEAHHRIACLRGEITRPWAWTAF